MSENVPQRPTYARIDLDNLAFNFHSVRDFVGPQVKLMAVVKADAYGHGAVECARRLETEGADWFSCDAESPGIRRRGLNQSLPLRILPRSMKFRLKSHITPFADHVRMRRADPRAAAMLAPRAVASEDRHGLGRVGIPFDHVGELSKCSDSHLDYRP